jgi:hypothetical protein
VDAALGSLSMPIDAKLAIFYVLNASLPPAIAFQLMWLQY